MSETDSDAMLRAERLRRVRFLNRLKSLNRYVRGDYVAVHKPLLILIALARVAAGAPRLISFPEVEAQLKELLLRYGGVAQATASYPFWRLQNDGVWEVQGAETLPSRDGNTDPPESVLRERRVAAGFLPQYDECLRLDATFVWECVTVIMENYFRQLSEEDQKTLLNEVGLGNGSVSSASHHTLHEAIRMVLAYMPGQTGTTETICAEIIRRGLYKQQKGGDPFPEQVYLRAKNYHQLFETLNRETIRLK